MRIRRVLLAIVLLSLGDKRRSQNMRRVFIFDGRIVTREDDKVPFRWGA